MSDFPQIFAFYSFKGGVGRSMAVLNLAFALAARRRNVLVLDMDLEAPGLSGFLHRESEISGFAPFDMVDLVRWATDAQPPLEPASFPPRADYVMHIPHVVNNAHPEALIGRLDIIPVEEQRAYYDRLTDLDMGRLDQGGLIRTGSVLREWLKRLRVPVEVPDYYGPNAEREAPYDYVLIDSRTGITETGGLCIGPLSDQLVILTALNDQNVEGTSKFLTEVGILPRNSLTLTQNGPSAAGTEGRHEAKPYLVVASLVPAGEIRKKEERLKRLEAAVGEAVVKLSYHPQLALQESIFTRDYRDEYLAREYEELLEQILDMANDGGDDGLRDMPLSRSPATLRDEAPRSPATLRDRLRRQLRAASATGSDALLSYLLSRSEFEKAIDDADFILWDQICRVLSRGNQSAPWGAVNAWGNLLAQWSVQSADARQATLRYNAALTRYEEILHAHSASSAEKSAALFNRAVTYGQRGLVDKEIEDYTAVIQMSDPAVEVKAKALVNRAGIYQRAEQPDMAIEDCTAVIAMTTATRVQRGLALVERAVAYKQKGQLDDGIEDCTAAIQISDEIPALKTLALSHRGIIHEQKGELDRAIEDHSAVIELSGDIPEFKAKKLLARAYLYEQINLPDRAIGDFTAVIEMSGAAPDLKAVALLGRARARLQSGNDAIAIEDYTALIQMDDAPPEPRAIALNNMSRWHLLNGRFQDAIQDSQRAIALDPRNSRARGNLSFALLVSGQREQALAACDQALDLADPKDLVEMATSLRDAIAEHGNLPGAEQILARIEARRLAVENSESRGGDS